MTIVVETGAGLTNSNSYVSESEVSTWATNRGYTLSDTVSQLIYKSMDYLETLAFIGLKETETQALQWPRTGVWIDGFYIEPTTIPQDLKNAQMALCVILDSGNGNFDPMDNTERAIKREKVGELELEYADSAANREIMTGINKHLRKLIKSGSQGSAFMVSRG